jgi:DNA-binding response OmpR family regulator
VHFKLSQAGYAVKAVCDGPAAWAAFQSDPPHLVLLDVQMPGMSGIDVLRRIREAGSTEVPVVLLSARSRDSDVDAGLAAGATEYLVKPFSPRALLAQIKGLAPLAEPICEDSPSSSVAPAPVPGL